MPILTLKTVKALAPAKRERLLARLAEVAADELDVPLAAMHVLIEHVDPSSWSIGGVSLQTILHGGHPEAAEPMPRAIVRDGVKLAALEWAGCEPALVIVPGITSPAATWRFVVEALDLPNRVILLDNRGRGDSDAPPFGYEADAYADDLLSWCDQLDLERPILAGHSMGARIVVRFAVKHPERTGGLAVIDPPLTGPGRESYPIPLSFYLDGIVAAKDGQTLEALHAQLPGWSDARVLDRMRWLPTCDVAAVSETYRLFHEEDFLADWQALRRPALLISGALSQVVTEAGASELAALQPLARSSRIDGAGHMIPWDNLPAFTATLAQYIEEQSN